ncbi:glycerol-3-phosphate dehydrogenase, mitochondrial-like isoform X3 [Littorina saxatilis]|uniref:glycerol-3-phosphate dehydrogenase, mitochondrial-like isoform X3 n=1 Tax=Littorina saxatilis TaxID=31220 RepID=UPI0038B43607
MMLTAGLKTSLVEKFDFASGTSSRSTKLIHGGVRYLQKAIFNLDIEQYRMVKESLTERANLLNIAPHLASSFPIMLPVYKWWQLPYYWAGIKMYDVVAGRQVLKPSYILSKTKALELFPMLKKDKLVGALVYYDGQHDDARMNVSLAITAVRYGASVANYTEVVSLLKTTDDDGKERVTGAHVKDRLSGREWDIKAKCVINATGPYTDRIRTLGKENIKKICQPSSGVHVVLPDYYSPESMGLLDPSTSDGRVIFFLPWQKVTVAGTTDRPCDVSDYPQPSEDEIQFILKEIRNYLSPDVEVRRGDVLSAWSGIRPLVSDPNKSDTQSIARNHIIEVADNKLITIAGGKWTTYRSMAEETVDRAVIACGLQPAQKCCTKGLLLDGAHGWSPTLFIRLVQDFGVENQVAQHLAATYGDKSFKVAKMCNLTGKRWPVLGKRLHEEYAYIEGEVKYAVREYACRAVDVLARRTRLAFTNVFAAKEALPRIVDIMAQELGWSEERKKEELEHADLFLRREMGLDIKQTSDVRLNFSKDEINQYVKRFKSLDYQNKGFITINDLRRYFKKIGERVSEDQLHDILSEVDLNRNAQVDLGEFLQLLSALQKVARDDETEKQYRKLAMILTSRIIRMRKRGANFPEESPQKGTISDVQFTDHNEAPIIYAPEYSVHVYGVENPVVYNVGEFIPTCDNGGNELYTVDEVYANASDMDDEEVQPKKRVDRGAGGDALVAEKKDAIESGAALGEASEGRSSKGTCTEVGAGEEPTKGGIGEGVPGEEQAEERAAGPTVDEEITVDATASEEFSEEIVAEEITGEAAASEEFSEEIVAVVETELVVDEEAPLSMQDTAEEEVGAGEVQETGVDEDLVSAVDADACGADVPEGIADVAEGIADETGDVAEGDTVIDIVVEMVTEDSPTEESFENTVDSTEE